LHLSVLQRDFQKSSRSDPENLAKVDEAFEFLNKFLEGHDWLAGSNITIADFAVVVTASCIEVSIYLQQHYHSGFRCCGNCLVHRGEHLPAAILP
jgi:glutathione S-transferase